MTTPSGIIVWWHSSLSTIPSGWQICDGTNGTPDLRSVFLVGASSDSDVGVTSGCSSHAHVSPSLGSAGDHSHSISGGTGNATSTTTGTTTPGGYAVTGQHTHSISGTTSSGGSHSHTGGDSGSGVVLPPYYKLYYIMKL